MNKHISDWLGIAAFVVLAFCIADGWRNARETNRFIERLLEHVEADDE